MKRSELKRTPFSRSKPLKASGPAKTTEKLVKCKAPGCGKRFLPAKPWQILCTDSVECAIEWAAAESAKKTAAELRRLERAAREEKRLDREQRKNLKKNADWAEDLQEQVNRYVRLRDHRAGRGCITCGTMTSDIWDAGHFHGRRARPELRFDLANIHLQCRACNYYHATGAIYRAAILGRIGQVELDRIDGPCPALNYRHPQYEEQIAVFKGMVKALEKEMK